MAGQVLTYSKPVSWAPPNHRHRVVHQLRQLGLAGMARAYEELTANPRGGERGYSGRPDHFRHLIACHRPRPKVEAYLRLRSLPGEQAQVDWGHFGHAAETQSPRPIFRYGSRQYAALATLKKAHPLLRIVGVDTELPYGTPVWLTSKKMARLPDSPKDGLHSAATVRLSDPSNPRIDLNQCAISCGGCRSSTNDH